MSVLSFNSQPGLADTPSQEDSNMTIRFVIHLGQGDCRCFSLRDLDVNLRFALKEGLRIVAVEAV